MSEWEARSAKGYTRSNAKDETLYGQGALERMINVGAYEGKISAILSEVLWGKALCWRSGCT
jgi:hypothetical protein